MSFVDRVALFLIDHVMPALAPNRRGRHGTSREELERLACAELQAQIDRRRPSPEESVRTRPVPEWAIRRPRAMRPLDVVAVRLDALTPPLPAPETARAPTRRARLNG